MKAEEDKNDLIKLPIILKESFINHDVNSENPKLIELFEFNLDSTTHVNICFKIYPTRGRVYPKKLETAFFASDRYYVCNRIEENCILVHGKSRRSDEVLARYYIDIKELRKLSDYEGILILEEQWPNLIKPSTED